MYTKFFFILFSLQASFSLVTSQPTCKLDRPIVDEYDSYENGLETHTSFKSNGEIDRRFFRRESGLGANANIITVLNNQFNGECFLLNWRENPAEHVSKHHYELIYRDKAQSCYQCFLIYNRTRNILEIRRSECDEVTSFESNIMNIRDLCLTINEESNLITLFC